VEILRRETWQGVTKRIYIYVRSQMGKTEREEANVRGAAGK